MSNENKKKKKVKVFTNKQKPSKSEVAYIQELEAKYSDISDIDKIKTFKDIPLCLKTQKGLKDAGYKVPTEIQKQTIMLALQGNDILGAAQTGSGKTLAFLIPMLEKLFCKQWTHLDGLGALIITPTRELALQIFETLKTVGAQHDFSCGLIIGGKDLKFERKRLGQCNIMICTPGRLLQHMDENPEFDANNLQILVLDEADRCLDMTFKGTMDAIIQNLPPQRQTFLFSATQTKSVKDLVRLNLKDPSYVAVHERAEHSTPDGLEQSYVVCELKDKVSVLWSFIKNHLKKKSIVFFATCKQVKLVFEVFSKMRPGVPLMAIYGRMHQLKRMKVYEDFKNKSAAVLFATDVVARGLDFPEVHWVVQVDCPEDADTYIHRVGRTARYHKGGESVLLLMPSELKMLDDLEKKKIPINKIKLDPAFVQDPYMKVQQIVAANKELQETARRAFVSYLKAVFKFKKRRDVFNIEGLDQNAFARSYGLFTVPRLRFLQKAAKSIEAKEKPNPNKIYFDEDGNPTTTKTVKAEDNSENVDKDSFYVFKEGEVGHNKAPDESLFDLCQVKIKKPTTKEALAKKLIREKAVSNKKIKFDQEGDPLEDGKKNKYKDFYDGAGVDVEKFKLYMKEVDEEDKKRYRALKQAKHKEQKKKLKELKKKEKEGEDVDDFGDSESDDDVDLSWVPDPDKIYGKENDSEHSDAESEEQEEEVNQEPISPKKKNKRKLEDSVEEPKKKKSKKQREIESESEEIPKVSRKIHTDHLTVDETEELALMLLNK